MQKTVHVIILETELKLDFFFFLLGGKKEKEFNKDLLFSYSRFCAAFTCREHDYEVKDIPLKSCTCSNHFISYSCYCFKVMKIIWILIFKGNPS